MSPVFETQSPIRFAELNKPSNVKHQLRGVASNNVDVNSNDKAPIRPIIAPSPGVLINRPYNPINSESKLELLSSTTGTVLLIICSNRPDYLQKTLDFILKYHPRIGYSIVISEDGQNDRIRSIIEDFKTQINDIHSEHMHTIDGISKSIVQDLIQTKDPVGTLVPVIHIHHPKYHEPAENGYFKLSKHFKYALSTIFSNNINILDMYRQMSSVLHKYNNKPTTLIPVEGFKRVLILEEDIQIAPDFFEYFTSVSKLIDTDTSVLCASAWNDNGFKHLITSNRI